MTTNEGEAEAVFEVADATEEVETHEESDAETKDTVDWKMKHDELAARLKRAETKLEKSKIEKKVEEVLEKKQGELDETQLDYLDLKGVSDPEEIEIVHKAMKLTGMTVRQALKEDYVQTKLAQLRQENSVKDAIPGSTRRSQGGALDTVDYWVNRAEQKGELPKDFALKTKVIAKLTGKNNTSIPPWRR